MDGLVRGDLDGGEAMSEKEKTQKLIYIVAVPVDQKEIDDIGFGEWIKAKREELMDEYKAKTVTISVFGKAVYVIGVERSTRVIDNIGFKRFLYQTRGLLMEKFDTKQAFVVAV